MQGRNLATIFGAAMALLCGAPKPATAKIRAATPQSSPAATAAAQALAHDEHGGVKISADAYSSEARAKEKFGKNNPYNAGILPVEVFIQNETNQPVRVDLTTIQLEVGIGENGRQDLSPLQVEDVAQLIVHPGGPVNPSVRRFPVGIPVSSDKKVQKVADSLRGMQLSGDIIAPQSTLHGFVFFNMNRDMALAGNSSLYVPDVVIIPQNKPLIFFEVPLGNRG
ncbi:MAG: hypothetical protein ACRD52_13065 [Candidatus Acidiferrales bacterium]